MNSEKFSNFMEEWRKVIIFDDDPSKFMSVYFENIREEYTFSKEQLMEIAATICGNRLPDVELQLGNTKLEGATFILLDRALKFIKTIQVNYELNETDFQFVRTVCPKVSLTSVLSTDQNIPLNVDARNVVLNSSTILRSGATKEEEPTYNPEKVLDALKNAQKVLGDLSAKNQQMKESIDTALSDRSINLAKFATKLYKEVSGMALTELTNPSNHVKLTIPIILQGLASALQQDYEKYHGWAEVFRVISKLVESLIPSNNAATYKHHVDKVVLLFADFIAINQNETWEQFKGNQDSLNTQELRQLRDVLDTLLTDAISSDYHIASRIFNATEINASEPAQSQIVCRAALHTLPMVRILDKLAAIMLTEEENHLPILEKALTAYRQIAEWSLSFAKKPSVMISKDYMTSYETLSKFYSKAYGNLLQIASILDRLGIKDCLLLQDTQQPVEIAQIKNIEHCINEFIERAIQDETTKLKTGLNSHEELFIQCSSALFELLLVQGDAHNVNQDIEEWIRKEFFRVVPDVMAKRSEPGTANTGSGSPRASEISIFKSKTNTPQQDSQTAGQAKGYSGGVYV